MSCLEHYWGLLGFLYYDICFDADRVTRAARVVASAPFSADLTLPDASGLSYVSVSVLTGVGVDIGSRKAGIGPGVLKGLRVIFSSWLRKEGCTRGLGVATEMGSGVGPKGGVGNSLIRSAAGSSSPICIVSIRASSRVVSTPNACLSSSSSFLTTSSTIVLTGTSLGVGAILAMPILGEEGSSGPVGASSSEVGSDGPG